MLELFTNWLLLPSEESQYVQIATPFGYPAWAAPTELETTL